MFFSEITPAGPTNEVQLVGTLTQHRDGALVRRRHFQSGGQANVLLMQLEEPDLRTYLLPFDLSDRQLERWKELLVAGATLVVSGHLERLESVDSRFGTADSSGLEMRTISIAVTEIRSATAEDAPGSWVRLRGTVDSVPLVRHHEQRQGLVARAYLTVVYTKPTLPGRAALLERASLPFEASVALPGHEALLRRGNVVALEGHLEQFIFRRDPADPAVIAALEEVEQQLRLRNLPPERQLSEARRQRQRILQPTGRRVQVKHVVLLEGQPQTLTDARRQRANHSQRRRQRLATI